MSSNVTAACIDIKSLSAGVVAASLSGRDRAQQDITREAARGANGATSCYIQ